MKISKKIIVGVVLLLIPAMCMAALAQEAQEADRGSEFGKLVSRRIIAMSFESSQKQNITTTDSEIYFYIVDGRNSISRIASDLLYTRMVYVVYGNDTTNSTLLQPDKNGTFTVPLPKVGTYTVVVRLQPAIPIPLVSSIITPSDADAIIIVKERAFPTTIVLVCVIAVVIGSGGWYIWKMMKRRELKEK